MVRGWLLLVVAKFASADKFNVSSVFGNDMVLQRDVLSAVYGYGSPGSKVTATVVTTGTRTTTTNTAATVVSAAGSWKVLLPKPYKGNTAATITLTSGADTVKLTGVVFGDIYFCSGQSNMELGLHFTLSKNRSFAALAGGQYSNVRILHFDHNPQREPTFVTNGSIVSPWQTAKDALTPVGSGRATTSAMEQFSGTCWYFGEALTDWMTKSAEGVMAIGLIESAFGGTMIESWVLPDVQLASCSNITCASNQTEQFTPETKAGCLAGGVLRDRGLEVPPVPSYDWSTATAIGAGANGELFNGMVAPFVNMSLKGFLWYQGENNLGFHAGNILDKAGYACMLPTLIGSWRDAWSVVPGTTATDAGFGIVMLADSTDEGWGCNVPQMHWAQTANVGFAPNRFLPNTFFAAAHDLPDPWADGCTQGAECCVDTGKPPDPRCDARHTGFLVQTGQFPGVTKPTTPSMGVTIHPRVKRQVGERLAQAAWSVVYEHDEVPFAGPVISGCSLSQGGASLTVRFNATLLKGEAVQVRDYNQTEEASVFWVLVDAAVPTDADKNYLYTNRQPWWGDSEEWHNVNIHAGSDPNTIVASLPAGVGPITAIKYGHQSPKGSPQSGEDKICCGNRNFQLGACEPDSCPVSSKGGLPAMPFYARIVDGHCSCFAPQTCNEH